MFKITDQRTHLFETLAALKDKEKPMEMALRWVIQSWKPRANAIATCSTALQSPLLRERRTYSTRRLKYNSQTQKATLRGLSGKDGAH